jgi:cell division protein ZipA
METPSWSLRIALLLAGLAVVVIVYVFSQWRRRRDLNRRHRRLRDVWPRRRGEFELEEEDAALDPGGARPPPEDDYEIIVLKPREKIEEMPALSHQTAAPEAAPEVSGDPPLAPIPAPDAPRRQPRKRRDSQLSLGFGETDDDAGEQAPLAPVPPQPEVLALYLRPLNDGRFNGEALVQAFANVGLKFGDMNIYHHYGAGNLRVTKPLFSLANMFEPGQFDPAEMTSFNTEGLAMFIQFPSVLSGPVAFELFLSVGQRLMEELKAELLCEPRKPLDALSIARMRRIAARYVPQR